MKYKFDTDQETRKRMAKCSYVNKWHIFFYTPK